MLPRVKHQQWAITQHNNVHVTFRNRIYWFPKSKFFWFPAKPFDRIVLDFYLQRNFYINVIYTDTQADKRMYCT